MSHSNNNNNSSHNPIYHNTPHPSTTEKENQYGITEVGTNEDSDSYGITDNNNRGNNNSMQSPNPDTNNYAGHPPGFYND